MEKTVNDLHARIKERPELVVPFISDLVKCPLFCERVVRLLHADSLAEEYDAARNLKHRISEHYHNGVSEYASALVARQ